MHRRAFADPKSPCRSVPGPHSGPIRWTANAADTLLDALAIVDEPLVRSHRPYMGPTRKRSR